MTVNLEKVFFKYILLNKKYFQYVEPRFFKNPEINMIYEVVHKYMKENINANVPKAKQIFEMIGLVDKDKRISAPVFKTLIQTQIVDYDEEIFLKPKLKAWILKERLKDTSDSVIEHVRELEGRDLDLELMEEYAGKIRASVTDNTVSNFDDDDNLGSYFDEAESHAQDHSATKVKTGWATLDAILGNGLDIATLNILMGETNSGKCTFDSLIYIRHKKTNEVEQIKINDFFDMCKK